MYLNYFFPENPLGLNLREARLADRVRGMQDENQVTSFVLDSLFLLSGKTV